MKQTPSNPILEFNIASLKISITKFWFWLLAIIIYIFGRLPYLFMPHWNFDEGVYLSIGSDLNQGFNLYSQTWDHKPPVLYWVYQLLLKISNNQYFIFPLVNFFLGLLIIFLVYKISYYFFTNQSKTSTLETKLPYLIVIITTLFLATGLWEAAVFNGENLFIPLILGSIYFFLFKKHWGFDILSGVLIALAIGTKANTVVELIGFFVGYLIINFSDLKNTIWRYARIIVTTVILILMVLINFNFKNELQFSLYSIFGYNTQYVEINNNEFSSIWGVPLFNGKRYQPDRNGISDLQLRTILLITWIVVLSLFTYQTKSRSKKILYLIWLGFGFYAVTLSSRNYSHYLLQLIPLLALGFGFIVEISFKIWQNYQQKFKLNSFFPILSAVLIWVICIQQIVFVFGSGSSKISLDVFPLELTYRDFYYSLATGKIEPWRADIQKYVYWYYPINQIIETSKQLTPVNGRFWHYSNISALCYYAERKCGYTAHLWFHIEGEIQNRTLDNLVKEPPNTIFVDDQIKANPEIQEFISKNYNLTKTIPDIFNNTPRYQFWILKV